MDKPLKPAEIKLSKEDVMKAVQMYLNNQKFTNNIVCTNLKKTRSENYYLIAEFE